MVGEAFGLEVGRGMLGLDKEGRRSRRISKLGLLGAWKGLGSRGKRSTT